MHQQPFAASREAIVADAIKEFVSELRLVDLADYVSFIHLGHIANLADLVDSAAELYFMPGTLQLGHGGDIDLYWRGESRVMLDLELKPAGARIFFKLSLGDTDAGIEVNYVSFDAPSEDPNENTAFLAEALKASRIRKSEPLRMAG